MGFLAETLGRTANLETAVKGQYEVLYAQIAAALTFDLRTLQFVETEERQRSPILMVIPNLTLPLGEYLNYTQKTGAPEIQIQFAERGAHKNTINRLAAPKAIMSIKASDDGKFAIAGTSLSRFPMQVTSDKLFEELDAFIDRHATPELKTAIKRALTANQTASAPAVNPPAA